MANISDARFKLTPVQQALYEVMRDKREKIANYYLASVVLLNDELLPDRLALAAHALREVMEKLANDGMEIDKGAALREQVKKLQLLWEKAIDEEQNVAEDKWMGGIGDLLRLFLNGVADFFRRQDVISDARREQAKRFLNKLEVSSIPLPKDVKEEHIDRWINLRKYFNDVAHHHFPVLDQEFKEKAARLELILVDRLNPRPTEDFAAIDELLTEE